MNILVSSTVVMVENDKMVFSVFHFFFFFFLKPCIKRVQLRTAIFYKYHEKATFRWNNVSAYLFSSPTGHRVIPEITNTEYGDIVSTEWWYILNTAFLNCTRFTRGSKKLKNNNNNNNDTPEMTQHVN